MIIFHETFLSEIRFINKINLSLSFFILGIDFYDIKLL